MSGAGGATTVDRQRFAEIMATFPSGVAVVTTVAQVPRGLTTTAVCSVSAEPPMLLVCVDRTSRTLPALRERRRFVVNIIRLGYQHVCRVFASKHDDKFAGLAWEPTSTGLPLLREHAAAWAECSTVEEVEAGDHLVLIGRVEEGGVIDPDVHPLMYYRREWGRWHPDDTGRG